MRNVTVICYLFSLLSFGMGYLKMLVYKDAIIEQVNTYDYTINLSLATSFLVLAIFLAVIGFVLYTLTIMEQKISSESNISNSLEIKREQYLERLRVFINSETPTSISGCSDFHYDESRIPHRSPEVQLKLNEVHSCDG